MQHTDAWHESTTTSGRRRLRRGTTTAAATAAAGALLLLSAGLLVPGTAQAASVVSAPTLDGTPAPAAVGDAYSFAFPVTGTPAPVCAVTAGELPPGLALGASDCSLTGTPTAGGLYPVTITASNGTQPDAVHPTTIGVSQSPALTDLTVPRGVAGQAFSYQLPVVGYPVPAVTWNYGTALPDGLTLEPDGLLHGVPTGSGTWLNVGIEVSNGLQTTFYNLTISIDPLAPEITSGEPPEVHAGHPYGFQFTATGVPTPIFVVRTPLPAGLTFDPQTGVLAGETAFVGDWPLILDASNGADVERSYMLHITGTAPYVVDMPPPATLNTFYAFRFDSGDSFPPPTFTVESGTLPPGLTLSVNGQLSGTPSQLGAGSPVTIRESNGTQPDALLTVVIPVLAVSPTINGTPPSPATVGADYYFDYTLGGNPAPTTTVTAGALPPGVTVSSNGYLTGSPTTPGTYTFTVTAGNGGASPDASVTSTVVVTDAIGVNGTPPAATVGRPYSFAFGLTGTPTPQVRVAGGSLPAGLTLRPDGVLSGTPTHQGTARFAVVADNGVLQAGRIVRLVVTSAPRLSIADAGTKEGNSGTKALTLTISLSSPSAVPVTVHWATADGTAKAGSDYSGASGTVRFAPGERAKKITVRITGDRLREATETFSVHLSNASGATVGDGDAVGRILNDD